MVNKQVNFHKNTFLKRTGKKIISLKNEKEDNEQDSSNNSSQYEYNTGFLDMHIHKLEKKIEDLKQKIQNQKKNRKSLEEYDFETDEKMVDLYFHFKMTFINPSEYKQYIIHKLKARKDGIYQKYKDVKVLKKYLHKYINLFSEEWKHKYILDILKLEIVFEKEFAPSSNAKKLFLLKKAIKDSEKLRQLYIDFLQ